VGYEQILIEINIVLSIIYAQTAPFFSPLLIDLRQIPKRDQLRRGDGDFERNPLITTVDQERLGHGHKIPTLAGV
jgi:hypothetical protein